MSKEKFKVTTVKNLREKLKNIGDSQYVKYKFVSIGERIIEPNRKIRSSNMPRRLEGFGTRPSPVMKGIKPVKVGKASESVIKGVNGEYSKLIEMNDNRILGKLTVSDAVGLKRTNRGKSIKKLNKRKK